MITGASFSRGISKQDYATPDDFRSAFCKRFGTPSFDLAASAENYFASGPCYFDEQINSLTQQWSELRGLLWLNPPFNDIAPWARKCRVAFSAGAHIALLTPASVGSEWFAQYVDGTAHVLFLRPRLSFDGKNPYPKDCILSIYRANQQPGYECWKWK